MLSTYFTIAIRSLSKNRFFTVINTVGLSIGLATGLLMLLWVKDELSFDRHHPEVERIYRENAHVNAGGKNLVFERCPAPHAAYALREIPEVERAVRVVDAGTLLVRHREVSNLEKRGAFADTSFFQVFQTEILAGNRMQPFGEPNSVVLTASFAQKYFGATKEYSTILGQTLHIDEVPLVVSAIMRDFPSNTLFQYDYIRPYEYLKAEFQPNELWKSREEDWGNCDDATYYRLSPGADIAAVGRKLGDLTHTHNKLDRGTSYFLQPFSQIHLYAADGSEAGAETVRLFGIVALFILLIACINYINLATAKATKRAREVGLRKAIGATRGQLIAQFLAESSIIFLISSVLALILAYVSLPCCNAIAGKQLQINWSDPSVILLLAGLLGAALLLSAIYPAIVLSAFNPLLVMKSQFSTQKDGQAMLRKGLVVVQFGCSSALLVAMFVIDRQMNFIRTKNLGYNRENVFQIRLNEQSYEHREAIIQELQRSPGILDVTSSSANILQNRILTGDTDWDEKSADFRMMISPISVAPNFLHFFKMSLVSGSDFSGTPADAHSYLINETAAAQMGIGDPVGKRFKLWETEGVIKGVVKDYHFASLHSAIKPAIFYSNPARENVICIKTTTEDATKAVESAGMLWKRFDAVYPFDYAFMDDSFDKMYRKELRTSQLFKGFGLIAMLISCLGLFGLSAFTVEQRNKEIGIRKVLGASVQGITGLLAKDFLKLVLVAIFIATPFAYFFMQNWLADFAYRIDIQWWMFAVAGLVAVIVAFLTVGLQSIRAALANPVESLRSE